MTGLAQTDDLYKPEDVRAFVNEMTNAVYFNRDCDELIGTFKEHAKLVALNRNTIEDIYGEIQGMYYRSRIPVLDKPQNIAKMSEALDEKVEKTLFICKFALFQMSYCLRYSFLKAVNFIQYFVFLVFSHI